MTQPPPPPPHTCRFLSMIQLVSKSSSSSPKGLMSCSATFGDGGGVFWGGGSENLDTLVPILSLGSGHSHSLMMPFLPNNCLQGHRIGPRHPPHGASMFLVSTLKTTAVPSCVTQPNHPLDLTLVTSSPQVASLFGTLIYLPRCTCLLFYGIRDKC